MIVPLLRLSPEPEGGEWGVFWWVDSDGVVVVVYGLEGGVHLVSQLRMLAVRKYSAERMRRAEMIWNWFGFMVVFGGRFRVG